MITGEDHDPGDEDRTSITPRGVSDVSLALELAAIDDGGMDPAYPTVLEWSAHMHANAGDVDREQAIEHLVRKLATGALT